MVNILQVLCFLGSTSRHLHWEKKKLQDYQNKRLKKIVKNAYDFVPFYHQRFKEAKVDVSSFRGLEDLSKLPVIKKNEFKSQFVQQITSQQFDLSELKKVRTSGSTGTPFEVYLTPHEDAWRKAIYMRANITCGQKPKDRWVVLTSPTHFGDTTSVQRKIGVFAQNCVSLFESSDERIRQIENANPDVLDGYSSALVLLAKEVKRRSLKKINPRLMFGNAEFIDPPSRQYIQDVFNAPYCDQFGCAEMDRTAWQCLERGSYHMDVDSVITEFLDNDGNTVADGERGEVVYTSLFNYAMPFIRYDIGDIGVPSDDTCNCEVTLPLMKIIEGRKDSFLKLPDNRVLSPMIFNFAVSRFKFYTDIEQYRIRQTKINYFDAELKMNKFSVKKDVMAKEFEIHLKEFLKLHNCDVSFNVSFVEEIPLSKNGKLNSVWSDLEPNILEANV